MGHTSTVWAVAFNASGSRMVSCSDDASLKVWWDTKGACVASLLGLGAGAHMEKHAMVSSMKVCLRERVRVEHPTEQ